MPIYEYECTECGNIEEAVQKMSDAPLTTCAACSGKLTKLISQSSFHLKGGGWYVTDYANKSTSDTKSSPKKTEKTETTAAKETGKTHEYQDYREDQQDDEYGCRVAPPKYRMTARRQI